MNTNLNSSHEYRGYAINEFTKLEKALDQYILIYFIPHQNNMQSPMHEIILDRLTFESKRTAVKSILDKKSDDTGFIKTKNNSYPYGKLFDEVRKLIDLRNNFAHFLDAYDSAEPKSVITLIKFRDKTDIIRYEQSEFDDLIFRIKKTTEDVLNLIPDGAEQ